jgi:hypothetical protein
MSVAGWVVRGDEEALEQQVGSRAEPCLGDAGEPFGGIRICPALSMEAPKHLSSGIRASSGGSADRQLILAVFGQLTDPLGELTLSGRVWIALTGFRRHLDEIFVQIQEIGERIESSGPATQARRNFRLRLGVFKTS